MPQVAISNWKRTITYRPGRLETVESVEDIVRIVRDTETYPSPVRVKGSHHSTTRCIVADRGTVIDVTRLDRILDIEARTITLQAGALLIDAARVLEPLVLQRAQRYAAVQPDSRHHSRAGAARLRAGDRTVPDPSPQTRPARPIL